MSFKTATAVAHPNIALVKYWGKRDRVENLPAADSVSLTLGPMHTRTRVEWTGEPGADTLHLDGREATEGETRRVTRLLDRIRANAPSTLGRARVESTNDFPTAAGMASSSSGFAALALAATSAAGLRLSSQELSGLARYGSGSAARSVFGGFAHMHAGERDDGSDAVAEAIAPASHWDLVVLFAVTTEAQKAVSSTVGMNRTQETSPYYGPWLEQVAADVPRAREAIAARDFARLTALAESSAARMHASALAAEPAVIYWNGATVDTIHAVRSWRDERGWPVFFTVDAGPHVKVFAEPRVEAEVAQALEALPYVLRVIRAVPGEAARLVSG